MKNRRPSRSYGKRKAPAGAFSESHGPRLLRHTRPVAGATDGDAPWISDLPAFGSPAVTPLPTDVVNRRR